MGLRTDHYATVVEDRPPVGWFEVISENFMVPGGNPRRVLHKVREHYPVVLHGVSLSIGGSDPLDPAYLTELARLAAEVEPAWVSDHLCWGSFGGHQAHDLLPLPYTEEALAHVARRVGAVQERLKRQILIENVSSYVSFEHSTMSEWEFLTALAERTDCGLLLDVNNVFVSAHNHGFEARAFLEGVPAERVKQVHLAGHSETGRLLLDTHDHAVCDGVWGLYREAVRRFGRVSTLVEWDDEIPEFAEVLAESRRAAAVEAEVVAETGGRVRKGQGQGQGQGEKRGASLAEVQRRLFELITAPEGVEAGLVAAASSARELGEIVRGDERGSAVERLDVYAGMYFYRLLDALRDTYPKVAAAVGDERFHNLVTDYVLACPSEHPSLRWVGARLPGFVAGHALAGARPWLGDLARLEWARADVFDGPDAAPLELETLRTLAPEAFAGLSLPLVPCCRRLSVGWDVEAAWAEPEAVPKAGAQTLLVWRRDVDVFHRAVDEREAGALARIAGGACFGVLCEWLAEKDGERAAEVAFQLLAQWTSDGVIAG